MEGTELFDEANCAADIYPDTCSLSCPCMPVAPFVQTIQHVEASQFVTTLLLLTLRIRVIRCGHPVMLILLKEKISCTSGLYSVLLRNKAVTAAFMSASLRKVIVFPSGLYVSDAPITVH
jgi:hypothetical protein